MSNPIPESEARSRGERPAVVAQFDRGDRSRDSGPARKLTLTRTQTAIAFVFAISAFIAAIALGLQAWVAYHDWACKVGTYAIAPCVSQPPAPAPRNLLRRGEPNRYYHPGRSYW